MLAYVRNRHLLLSDLLLFTAAPFVACALRFEGFDWPPPYLHIVVVYTALAVPLKLVVCVAFDLYARLWRQASIPDLVKILQAGVVIGATCSALGIVALPASGLTAGRVPISVVSLDVFFSLSAVGFARLLMRVVATWQQRRRLSVRGRRALIAGAGAAGEMILKEMLANPQLGLKPVGFVDDDPSKRDKRLADVPILGSLSEIPVIAREQPIDEIVIAMPRAPGAVVRRVVRAAQQVNLPTRTVPGLFEILSGRLRLTHLRKVEIHDLLRRAPVTTDTTPVQALVRSRGVLITGAGGSIGSELARQLARLEPSQLVLFGNGENEIFDIVSELADAHPGRGATLSPIIGDVRDDPRLRAAFAQFRPDVVFHAAAHKHVPLMEDNACEAVTNNVLGTKNVVACALEAGVGRLVLISTDKAVRPTSVMGASKRVAEMVVQDAALTHRRNFVSVRFGNVLGSRGSVVPTFLRQIQAGGPVTVTHPAMRRFFMTIPEAVQLVLQAAMLGQGGELFELDMGEPVRILDLATDMIRLSGLEVGRDIEIRYTGMRPGERLDEERFLQNEDVVPTAHPKILRARNDHVPVDFACLLEPLIEAARECRPEDELRRRLKAVVPEFDAARVRPEIAEAPRRQAHYGRPARARSAPTERRAGADRRRGARRRLVVAWSPERRARGDRRSGLERRVPATAAAPAASLVVPPVDHDISPSRALSSGG